MTLMALDIETECGVGCEEKCDHALDEFRNRITVVGVVHRNAAGELVGKTFRDLRDLVGYVGSASFSGARLVGHNMKFDMKTLLNHGVDLTKYWAHDTLLMAATMVEKVPEHYLRWYAAERDRLNQARPKGKGHRPGSQHSLKVLAPYFLNVPAFWEPIDHDNDDYVLKDVEYTLLLTELFQGKLAMEGGLSFYQDKLLPWTKMLLDAEMRGISLDMKALDIADADARLTARYAKIRLDDLWADAHKHYWKVQCMKLDEDYAAKLDVALAKAKDKSKTIERYRGLLQAAQDKVSRTLNLDSPSQLKWLLQDYLQLDITDFDGDDTTGKAVLQRLAGEGHEDIATFLRYREARKLSQAFFPGYRAVNVDGIIHSHFNPTGTRTGRLSSSEPNLQQVAKGIHHLFVARPGYRLATYDMSAIEPRLIAYYTGDQNLVDIIQQGKDFHNYNTAIFFDLDLATPEFKKRYGKEREVGKEVGLALMYGAGVKRLRESAQKRGFVWSERDARYKLDRFREFYSGVYEFRDEVIAPALRQGPITNLLGRNIAIPDPDDIHMQGLNTLIQSSASDLVVNSAYRMTKEFRARGIDAHVLLLVHDEIVTEVPENQADECVNLIVTSMTNYPLVSARGPIELKVEGKVAHTWEK